MNDIQPPAMPRRMARVTGVATILAPLLLLLSTVAYVTQGEGVNQGMLGGVIGVWSIFALLIGFTGIIRLLEPRAPRFAPWLLVVSMIGFSAGVGFNVDAMFSTVGAPELAGTTAEDGEAIGLLAFLPWGWFTPLAMVLVGAVLWRTRTVAWWSAALLILGGLTFISARPARIDALAIASDVVLVAALVPIGLAVLRSARSQTPTGVPVHTA